MVSDRPYVEALQRQYRAQIANALGTGRSRPSTELTNSGTIGAGQGTGRSIGGQVIPLADNPSFSSPLPQFNAGGPGQGMPGPETGGGLVGGGPVTPKGDIASEAIGNSWLGKTINSAANTSGGSLILKILGTTGALTQPVSGDAMGRLGNVARTIKRSADNSFVDGALDLLSRKTTGQPLGDVDYKSENRFNTADDDTPGINPFGALEHGIEQFRRGVENADKLWRGNKEDPKDRVKMGVDSIDAFAGNTPEDRDKLLRSNAAASWLRAGQGLGMDLVTDPLSYATGAGALKTARVLKRTAPGTTGARGAAEVAEAAGEKAPSFVRRFAEDWKASESANRFKNPNASRTAGRRSTALSADEISEIASTGGKTAANNANDAIKAFKDKPSFISHAVNGSDEPKVLTPTELAKGDDLTKGTHVVPEDMPFLPAGQHITPENLPRTTGGHITPQGMPESLGQHINAQQILKVTPEVLGVAKKEVAPLVSRGLNIPAPFRLTEAFNEVIKDVPAPVHVDAETMTLPPGVLMTKAPVTGKAASRPITVKNPDLPLEGVQQIILSGKAGKLPVANHSITKLRELFVQHTGGVSPEEWVRKAAPDPSEAPMMQVTERVPTGEMVAHRWADRAKDAIIPAENMNTWRQALGRAVKAGRLTKKEAEALKAQAKIPDIKAFHELVNKINHEPIKTISDDVMDAAGAGTIADEVVDSVEVLSPAARLEREMADEMNLLKTTVNGQSVDLLPTVNKVWKSRMDEIVRRFRREGDYTESSPGGTALNSTAGRGDNVEGFNTLTQRDLFEDVLRDSKFSKAIEDAMRESGIKPMEGTVYNKRPRGLIDDDGVRTMAIMNMTEALANRARRAGIEPSIGYGRTGKPIALYDVMHAIINKSAPSMKSSTAKAVGQALPNRTIAYMFGNYGSAVPISNLMDAVDTVLSKMLEDMPGTLTAIRSGDPVIFDEVLADLSKTQAFTAAGKTRDIKAPILGNFPDKPAQVLGVQKATAAKFNAPFRRADRIPSEKLADHLLPLYARAVLEAAEPLYDSMIRNAQRAGLKEVAETRTLSVDFFEKASEIFNKGPQSSQMDLVKAPEKVIDASARVIQAMPSSKLAAKKVVAEDFNVMVPKALREEFVETAKVSAANNRAFGNSTSKAVADAKNAAQLKYDAAAERALKSAGDDGMDLDLTAEIAINGGIVSKLGEFFKKFAYHSDKGEVGNMADLAGQHSRDISRGYVEQLKSTMRTYAGKSTNTDTTIFNEAFYLVKSGSEIPPAMAKPVEDVQALVQAMFSTADPKSLVSHTERMAAITDTAFTREFGNNLAYINRILARNTKAETRFKFELGEAKNLHDVATQWKSWDIKDPAEFLNVMQTALITAARDASVAQEFIRSARKTGAMSSTPRPGWVRFKSDKTQSSFMPFMPNDVWFEPTVAGHFRQVDRFLQEMAQPGGKISKWFRDYYMPTQDLWKSGMTIWNPRHHFANIVGDMSMTYIAGHAGAYTRAMKILKARGYLKTDDAGNLMQHTAWGKNQAMDAMERRATGSQMPLAENVRSLKPNEVIATVTLKGGKKIRLTQEDIWLSFKERGGLPATPIRESMGAEMVEASTNVAKTDAWREKLAVSAKGPRRGKMPIRERAIVPFSEGRDHMARLAHYIPELESQSKHYSNIEDLFDASTQQVRKWHPDGSGMTPFEQKYMRTIMPFYSWSRKAIPLTLESFFTKPGRVVAYPKAMYAVAEANNLDLQSLADPFPADQMFPSFLRENMTGPLWQATDGSYMAVRPGIFFSDITTEFGGGSYADAMGGDTPLLDMGPTRGFLNMISPLLKAPLELSTMQSVGTGGRISDRSDYIDSQIPGVNVASQLSGVSPTGTLLNNTGPRIQAASQGMEYDQPFLDPTRAEEKGTRDGSRQWFNWLLGQRLQNQSQESYINLAEIEARERATPRNF